VLLRRIFVEHNIGQQPCVQGFGTTCLPYCAMDALARCAPFNSMPLSFDAISALSQDTIMRDTVE
jgi:hypothetical protein